MRRGSLPFLTSSYVLLDGVTELRLLRALYDSVALGVYVEAVVKPCKKAETGQTKTFAVVIISETFCRKQGSEICCQALQFPPVRT